MTNIQTTSIKMDNSKIFESFNRHLNIEGNDRIFFSGKFGSGKTYFIDEYFKNKQDEYEYFHICPVNYQISSNEDIIQFLKYDILVELLKDKKIEFETKDYLNFIDISRLLYIWSSDNKINLAKSGLSSLDTLFGGDASILPKLGKAVGETLPLLEKFWEFKKTIEEGDKKIIDDFIKATKNITQTDYISQLITEKIATKKGTKKSVLVLDDLDRIDPDHVFRILNVFSAHFNDTDNKFLFDKVILVGDIDNFTSIFHHRYGSEADDVGYFNKFYSVEIFHLNNQELIKNFVTEVVKSMKYHLSFQGSLGVPEGYMQILLSDILQRAATIKGKSKLQMRELIKCTNFSFPILQTEINNNYPTRFYFDTALSVLKTIFGGRRDRFMEVVRALPFKKDEDGFYKTFGYYFFVWTKEFLGKKPESKLEIYNGDTITLEHGTYGRGEIVDITFSNEKDSSNLIYEDKYFLFYKKILLDYIEKGIYENIYRS